MTHFTWRLLQTTIKNPRIDERWFLSGPIGKNKIESLMKFMAKKKAGLPEDRKIT